MSESVAPYLEGTVAEVFPKQCHVIPDNDVNHRILCPYRRGSVVEREPEWRERSPVAPGDRVRIQVFGAKDGVVVERLERKNLLQRRAPGKEGQVVHTLVANIDYLVIVSSFKEPEFSPGLIDRFLIAAEQAEIQPIIVVTKQDLNPMGASPWGIYETFQVKVFPVSTHTGGGIDPLREFLRGKTSAFCGHSGVGKTSLLNQLFRKDIGKIGTVNAMTGKGKHTTTVSTLTVFENTTRWIDTPGIKEFGLIKIAPRDLIQFFPELAQAQFRGEDLSSYARYHSYQKIKVALETEGR